jgi:TolB-like protein/Flp pilus assembly protein TadD
MPNNISRFWKELKRRRVHRLMAIYAGSAYVIFEASTLIFPRWGLPDWTIDLVLYLLILGAIVTFVMGWIYDLTPDGIQKTRPVSETSTKEASPTPNGWKIASYISLVVIVILLVLNIVPRTGKNEILDKSIAVLPFINDSPASENDHVVNGYMTAVHNNLSKIGDLRVLTLQSSEQYRTQNKSIPEIAKELGVSYLLSARGQIFNNRMRLVVQLANANDDLIWSNPYDRQIELVEDHIDIQSNIAQLVADEIQVVISPEVKEIMSKIPTTSLTAWDLYQRGFDVYHNYLYNNDLEALDRAESFFHEALRLDSTYAEAYIGLSDIIWDKHNLQSGYFEENFQDSALSLLNLALTFDEKSSYAYALRAYYYREIGRHDLAISDLERAVHFNPNYGRAYNVMGILYQDSDFIKALDSFHKAVALDRGSHLPTYLRNLSGHYFLAGFREKSYNYMEEYLKLTSDSALYYFAMAQDAAFWREDNKAIDYSRKAIALDSTLGQGILAGALIRSGKQKEALEVYKSWFNAMNERGVPYYNYAHRIAYAYSINGLEKEAEYYFDRQIEYSLRLINSNRPWIRYTYYDLAGVYAFRGDREKAYENLRIISQIEEVPYWLVHLFRTDPLFDNIRDEPEFQQIVRDVEAKYQASHERVRQWLEENDLL